MLYNVPLSVPKKTHSQVVGITCMSWSVDNKLACSLVTTAKDPSHMSERFEYLCIALVAMLSVMIIWRWERVDSW